MKKTAAVCCLLFLLIQIASAQVPLLYGLTSAGGKYSNGAILKVIGNGSGFDTVYSFHQFLGYQPWGSLIDNSNGTLFGMTQLGGSQDRGVIFSFNPSANNYKDLHNFNDTAGAYPQGDLVQATDGKLYGLTSGGGANLSNSFGVIFSYDSITNTFTDLHDFSGLDGQNPSGSLIQNGTKLYGLTTLGGNHTYGVIFSYDISSNTFSKLYDLDGLHGEVSYGSMIKANNGSFYGLTSAGGAHGFGVIFSFNPSGNIYSDLYDFDGTGNGNAPHGSLISAIDGKLYGMTELGGNNGQGIIFRFNPDSNTFKKLHDFDGNDGWQPHGSLVQGSDGKLYGMTADGGSDTLGSVFSIDPTNNTFNSFATCDGITGANPYGDLVQVSTVSGIEQLSPNNALVSIYPNPTSGSFSVTSQKSIDQVKIFNVIGQLIYAAQPKQMQTIINIKEDGLYFISITSNNQAVTSKVIVSK